MRTPVREHPVPSTGDAVARWSATLERDGYVRIPAAVPPDLRARLVNDVDAVRREEVTAGRAKAGEALHLLGFVARRPSFLELLDLAPAFEVVCRLLGWNIQLYHSHLDVHPPTRAEGPAWGWHQDGGRLNLDLETDPRPRISLKVAYWLSDVGQPGRGNIRVVPGSHRDNTLRRPAEGGPPTPVGATDVLADPGDAIVFDRRLWHSRTANRSTHTRRALFLAYAPRWLRPRDDHGLADLADDQPGLTAVRRQLLGAGDGLMDHWGLDPAVVPLRQRLEARGALDPAVPAHR